MLGLLLIDHGSRRAEANAQLEDMAERVRRLRPGDLVGIAHLEIAAPSIADGFAALARAGAREVRALPYFLSDGRHSREDIPRLIDHVLVTTSLLDAYGDGATEAVHLEDSVTGYVKQVSDHRPIRARFALP
jgi:hypothetical protein